MPAPRRFRIVLLCANGLLVTALAVLLFARPVPWGAAAGPERWLLQVDDVRLLLDDDGQRLLLLDLPPGAAPEADHRAALSGETFAALCAAVGMDGEAALQAFSAPGERAERLQRQQAVLLELLRRGAAGRLTVGLTDLLRLVRRIETDLLRDDLYARITRWSGLPMQAALLPGRQEGGSFVVDRQGLEALLRP